MNSQNIIPVFSGRLPDSSETLLCDARKLHEFLQVETPFNKWINRRIKEYGFQENQDFLSFGQNCLKPQGGRPTTEYHLTLDMAKELAMVERNEQGRAARRYFIECERQAQQIQNMPVALPKKRTAKKVCFTPEQVSSMVYQLYIASVVVGNVKKEVLPILHLLNSQNTGHWQNIVDSYSKTTEEHCRMLYAVLPQEYLDFKGKRLTVAQYLEKAFYANDYQGLAV